jgi:hypothetical protein
MTTTLIEGFDHDAVALAVRRDEADDVLVVGGQRVDPASQLAEDGG